MGRAGRPQFDDSGTCIVSRLLRSPLTSDYVRQQTQAEGRVSLQVKLISVSKHLQSQDDCRKLSSPQSDRTHQQRDWTWHHQEYRVRQELAKEVGDQIKLRS